jgi:hypothetical protein
MTLYRAVPIGDELPDDPGEWLAQLGGPDGMRLVEVVGPAYRRQCDSATHDPKGEVNEFDQVTEDEPEAIDNRCLDWHPQLVWYEEIGGDG